MAENQESPQKPVVPYATPVPTPPRSAVLGSMVAWLGVTSAIVGCIPMYMGIGFALKAYSDRNGDRREGEITGTFFLLLVALICFSLAFRWCREGYRAITGKEKFKFKI
jgi:hypothetical protein